MMNENNAAAARLSATCHPVQAASYCERISRAPGFGNGDWRTIRSISDLENVFRELREVLESLERTSQEQSNVALQVRSAAQAQTEEWLHLPLVADGARPLEGLGEGSVFEGIVSSSDSMKRVLQEVVTVAGSECTTLLLGETGTGKELLARAIHRRSHRASMPFIRVNCAAIPQSLIASELFGHEKGAFTGAVQRRPGRFEIADRGTIFLDEVGDLPAETQVALLRVLQEREIERVGSNHTIRVNVRIIAATNRNLEEAVASGAFRQDLFYRLAVYPIKVPALRERASDIPPLLRFFLTLHAKQCGRRITHVSQETLDLFNRYHWPGNIRELQNVVERSVLVCDAQTLRADERWLAPSSLKQRPDSTSFQDLVEREKQMIETALSRCQGRISGPGGAAEILGVPRQTLESKIARLGVDKCHFKKQRGVVTN